MGGKGTGGREGPDGKSGGKDLGDVRKFLNRLLGIPVARQALLFNYFLAVLQAEIEFAKEEGRYSEGVGEISGANVKKGDEPYVSFQVWVICHMLLNCTCVCLLLWANLWSSVCRSYGT